VELDGIDIRELRPDSLREHLGVARKVEIFSGTVEENVHLNRANLSVQDVRNALQTVGLLDPILQLPEGLNTHLRTGGSPLTESQAAQLMIARAIVGSPRLLLIDGTLDLLSPDVRQSVLDRLLSSTISGNGRETPDGGAHPPWTLLIATNHRQVAERCEGSFSLNDTKRT
jgi:ABC-type multidrug transport system fused ATPase/permease subunit